MPRNVSSIRREHVEAYLDYLLNERVDERNGRRLRPATAKNRYASLRAFFAWAVREGEVKRSPMATMQPPKVDETLTPVLTEDNRHPHSRRGAAVRRSGPFPGDGDYVPVVEAVKRIGLHVVVGFFKDNGLSDELRIAADDFVDLTEDFVARWSPD